MAWVDVALIAFGAAMVGFGIGYRWGRANMLPWNRCAAEMRKTKRGE